MLSPDTLLIWFLRLSAAMFLAAAPAVVMPVDWMDTIGQWYGLDKLPDVPLMGYLTRHMSALYAGMGASYWYISCDVRRYMPLVRFTVPVSLVLALAIVAIDVAVGMPVIWTVGEAVSMSSWTLVLWWLARRASANR